MDLCYALTMSICLLFPANAGAQLADASCDDSARMAYMLANALGAERQGSGLRDPDTLLEIWVCYGLSETQTFLAPMEEWNETGFEPIGYGVGFHVSRTRDCAVRWCFETACEL